MIRIRRGIFETNSSSGDYYGDYDEPDMTVDVTETVKIVLDWNKNITPLEYNDICTIIQDERTIDRLGRELCKLVDYEDAEFNDISFENNDILVQLKGMSDSRCVFSGCDATWYNPPEPPEYEVISVGINGLKQETKKKFANNFIKYITKIWRLARGNASLDASKFVRIVSVSSKLYSDFNFRF